MSHVVWRAFRVEDLQLGAIDGTQVCMPDTPVNRETFGPAGIADDSAPFPAACSLPIDKRQHPMRPVANLQC
jgi:hypothetical protein